MLEEEWIRAIEAIHLVAQIGLSGILGMGVRWLV